MIKYLGIDWGKTRIGLALANNETKLAIPFKVVEGINDLIKTINDEKIDLIVVGEPLNMPNVKSQMSKSYIDFLNLLRKENKIPIKTVDERLTSKAADALAGSRKTKAPRDTIAAMLILQTFLDRTYK